MINLKLAKKLARKYLLNEKTPDGDFLFAHTKGVVTSIRILSQRFGLEANKMISLAWVHDIGYFLNDPKNHAENSLKLLNNEKIYLTKKEKDCILNHGNGKKPFSKEGKIMQIADKISILHEDFLKILFSKKNIKDDEINFAKMMCGKSIEMLKKSKTFEGNKR